MVRWLKPSTYALGRQTLPVMMLLQFGERQGKFFLQAGIPHCLWGASHDR